MTNEKLYTLEEAKEIVKREECDKQGHYLSIELEHRHEGASEPVKVFCNRCEREWPIAVPDDK